MFRRSAIRCIQLHAPTNRHRRSLGTGEMRREWRERQIDGIHRRRAFAIAEAQQSSMQRALRSVQHEAEMTAIHSVKSSPRGIQEKSRPAAEQQAAAMRAAREMLGVADAARKQRNRLQGFVHDEMQARKREYRSSFRR